MIYAPTDDVEFEMISLAAATRNAIAFLMLTREEKAATPGDAAAGADATPWSVGREKDVTTAPTDWGSELDAVATRTSALGDTEARSGEWIAAPVTRHLLFQRRMGEQRRGANQIQRASFLRTTE
jgi:hypothetical protein